MLSTNMQTAKQSNHIYSCRLCSSRFARVRRTAGLRCFAESFPPPRVPDARLQKPITIPPLANCYHYVNLTNGLEAIPHLTALGLPYQFARCGSAFSRAVTGQQHRRWQDMTYPWQRAEYNQHTVSSSDLKISSSRRTLVSALLRCMRVQYWVTSCLGKPQRRPIRCGVKHVYFAGLLMGMATGHTCVLNSPCASPGNVCFVGLPQWP